MLGCAAANLNEARDRGSDLVGAAVTMIVL